MTVQFFCLGIVVVLWMAALRFYSAVRLFFLAFLSVLVGAVVPVILHWSGAVCQLGFYDFLYWLALPLIFLIIGLRYSPFLVSVCASLVNVLSFVILLPNVFYYAVLRIPFSSYGAGAILQTDLIETKEFLSVYVGIGETIGAVFFVLAAFVLYFEIYYSVFKDRVEGYIPLHITLSCILIFALAVCSTQTLVGRAFTDAFMKRNYFGSLSFESEERLKNLPSEFIYGGEGNMALVIGESHNASHASVLGYERATMPWFRTMLHEKRAILFSNVYACGTNTGSVIPLMLTAQNQYQDTARKDALTLVETARLAGYKVVWMSMQNPDGVVEFLGNQADEKYWLRQSTGSVMDMGIVDAIRRFKKPKQKTLYILQLVGSHVRYASRYPAEFTVWNGRNKLDEYDNSVLYNDRIMHDIYEELMGRLVVDAMLYVPDHGEEVNRYFHHGNDLFLTKHQTDSNMWDIMHIPMYLIYSDEYVEKNYDKMKLLRSHANGYFTNDLVYDLMLGIMNINGAGHKRKLDLSCPEYDRKKENLTVCDGKVPLSTLP